MPNRQGTPSQSISETRMTKFFKQLSRDLPVYYPCFLCRRMHFWQKLPTYWSRLRPLTQPRLWASITSSAHRPRIPGFHSDQLGDRPTEESSEVNVTGIGCKGALSRIVPISSDYLEDAVAFVGDQTFDRQLRQSFENKCSSSGLKNFVWVPKSLPFRFPTTADHQTSYLEGSSKHLNSASTSF
jgi:hypothetical protein